MASISHPLSLFVRRTCSNQEQKHKHKLYSVKFNATYNPQRTSQNRDKISERENIRAQQQLVEPYRREIIAQDEGEYTGYRQTFVIRSNEVGPDKAATIESILYLLQETALNHAWASGVQGNRCRGTDTAHEVNRNNGTTTGMIRNNLIWVLSRMNLQVDHYPIWGDVVEIDTWSAAAGRNGMRRDWILRSQATGLVFARATSTWAMINEHTRRLSKMPDEVRAELSPKFIDKQAIEEEEGREKFEKIDKAWHTSSGMEAKRSDLDMNHHVNNVKYVRWMLEVIPDEVLESHQLSGIIIEYKRECLFSDVVQSLCGPGPGPVNGNSWASTQGPISYTHLLQKKGHEPKNEEIARGKTTWKRKY